MRQNYDNNLDVAMIKRTHVQRQRGVCVALAVVFGLLPGYARALSLGDIHVSSGLGQPLRAQVPVSAKAGEELTSDCVSVVRDDPFGGDSIGLIPRANITVRNVSGQSLLFISSSDPIHEPVARLLLRVSCGDLGNVYREYTLLLDPPRYETAATQAIDLPTAPPAPQYKRELLSGINEYIVREGDSLESIARGRYPFDPLQQRRLRRAIAAANSDVLADENSALPTAGTPILIPELAPQPKLAKKAKARAKPKRLAKRRTRPAAPPPEPAPQIEAQASAAPSSEPKASAPTASPTFVLRLSRSALDLNTNRPISEQERVALRERQRLLDADDLTASMLSLQHEMRQMKAEIEALKAQLRAQQGSAPTGTEPVATAPATPAPSIAPAPPAPAEAPKPQASVPATVVGQPPAASESWYEAWLKPLQRWWWLLPLAALALLLVGMLRRRRKPAQYEEFQPVETEAPPATAAPTASARTAKVGKTDVDWDLDTVAAEVPEPVRSDVTVKIEADLAKRQGEMQARYLSDRFPEFVQSGASVANPDAVIEQSRIYFMEDGAADKAIELLEYVVSIHPQHPKLWLALLEIYRQMKMKGAFEKLALAFRDRFRDIEQWKKVCSIGHMLDPRNPLYAEHAAAASEPAAAADATPAPAPAAADKAAANWLDVPLDFTPALHGDELRSQLLAELPVERAEPKVAKDLRTALDLDLGPSEAEEDEAQRIEPKLAHKQTE